MRCLRSSEAIDGKFQIDATVIFFFWQTATPQIDLECRKDTVRQGQGCVTLVTAFDPLLTARAILHMPVIGLVLGHRGFPHRLVAIIGAVIMADEQPRFNWQRKYVL